jgi:hypothetical protein
MCASWKEQLMDGSTMPPPCIPSASYCNGSLLEEQLFLWTMSMATSNNTKMYKIKRGTGNIEIEKWREENRKGA